MKALEVQLFTATRAGNTGTVVNPLNESIDSFSGKSEALCALSDTSVSGWDSLTRIVGSNAQPAYYASICIVFKERFIRR
jgi:hypothetical protein